MPDRDNDTDRTFRGIFGIAPTPFLPDETIDHRSLESALHFTVESGCHGVVMPVMASEVGSLTDEERLQITETTVRVVDGRVPVVIGVSGISAAHSIGLAKHAQDAGADAVIAMPPHGRPPSRDEVVGFFHALGEVLSIPVFIQNHSTGYAMDPPTLAEVCRDAPNVSYVKEESPFAGHVAILVLELAGDACDGVMGGASGRFLIDEFKRGECGNMPASHYGDVHSAIWNLLEAGDEAGAREIYNRLMPLINFENLHGIAAFKEVFVRRGVIAHNTMRSPGRHALDRYDLAELDLMLAAVRDLLTWEKA